MKNVLICFSELHKMHRSKDVKALNWQIVWSGTKNEWGGQESKEELCRPEYPKYSATSEIDDFGNSCSSRERKKKYILIYCSTNLILELALWIVEHLALKSTKLAHWKEARLGV